MPCYSIFHNAVYKETVVEELKTSHHVEEIMIDILREDLGWDGMVTSDWGAVTGKLCRVLLISRLADHATVSRQMSQLTMLSSHTLTAVVTRLVWAAMTSGLKPLLTVFITQEQYDNAAKKCVEVTFKVGAFENPYVDEDNVDAFFQGLEDKIAEVTRKAMVLVKNEDSTLPVASGEKGVTLMVLMTLCSATLRMSP